MSLTQKKDKQWQIDRAYNMSLDNKDRTVDILIGIKNIKDKIISEQDGLDALTKKGVINSPRRYLQSTATGLRNYGLVEGPYETTEVADALINGDLPYHSMLLLQLLKKEYKYDESSPVIRPLIVLCSVLLKLFQLDENNAWIDAYDYLTHLTEVKSMDDIDTCVNNILVDKLKNRTINYLTINDFDIWLTAFIVSGIVVVNDTTVNKRLWKAYINKKNIELMNFIVDNYKMISSIGTYKGRGQYTNSQEKKDIQKKFGLLDYGLFDMMPKIELEQQLKIKNIIKNKKRILELFLIEGKDYKDIDKYITGIDNLDVIDGSISKLIIKSFGLNDKHQGIWKPFSNHREFIKLNKEYKNLKEIYAVLFERNDNNMLKLNRNREVNGNNYLYYGIPGCGKSYSVKNM